MVFISIPCLLKALILTGFCQCVSPISLGGITNLPNKEPYDPYKEYIVLWPAGWDRATVCGRDVALKGKVFELPVSLWSNGVKNEACEIILYKNNCEKSASITLLENNDLTVFDDYTGKTYKASGLEKNCKQTCNEPKMECICSLSNLTAIQSDEDEVAYHGVAKDKRPKVKLTISDPPKCQ